MKITVEDTGIGIKEEYFDHLFDIFSSTEDSLAINLSSSHGFGLNMSKKLSL